MPAPNAHVYVVGCCVRPCTKARNDRMLPKRTCTRHYFFHPLFFFVIEYWKAASL